MSVFVIVAGVLALYMCAWFGVSIALQRNDVADLAWGPGFVLVAWMAVVFGDVVGIPSVIAAVLVSVWGARLVWYIRGRFVGHAREDERYAQWRRTWKFFYMRSFLQVFVLQGVLLYLVALPLMVAADHGASVPVWMLAGGVAVWVFGFVFEVVGDAQLRVFLADVENRGQVMTRGLWRYTRHPNYFGEMVLWWGVWLVLGGWLLPLWAVVGPAVITILLRFVSGVPMAERLTSQLDGWTAYAARTSMLVPWWPKNI